MSITSSKLESDYADIREVKHILHQNKAPMETLGIFDRVKLVFVTPGTHNNGYVDPIESPQVNSFKAVTKNTHLYGKQQGFFSSTMPNCA